MKKEADASFFIDKAAAISYYREQPIDAETDMLFMLGGRSESYDLALIIFGAALFFGLLSFILIFPSWHRQRLREQREAEFLAAIAATHGGGTPEDREASDTGEPEHHVS